MGDVMIFNEPDHGSVPDHCKSVEYRKAPCPERLRWKLWCSYCQDRWSSVEEYQARFKLPYVDDDFHRRVAAEAAQRAEDAEVRITMINDKTQPERDVSPFDALIAAAAAGPFPDLDEPIHRALYLTDLDGTPEPPSLEDLLTDAIDTYLNEDRFSYLSGNKEDGYAIDGGINPRFLAQRLVTIIEKEKNA